MLQLSAEQLRVLRRLYLLGALNHTAMVGYQAVPVLPATQKKLEALGLVCATQADYRGFLYLSEAGVAEVETRMAKHALVV